MIEQIKKIIDMGGKVSFPYKTEIEYPLDSVIIYYSNIFDEPYVVSYYGFSFFYSSIDDAIDKFIKLVFTNNNLGLAISGIRKHKLTNKDLDDLSDKQIINLCQLYFEKYLNEDFGEITTLLKDSR